MIRVCPAGEVEIKECVKFQEGLRNKEEGITDIHHSVFSVLCPYKQAWTQAKHPFPLQC